VHSSSSKYNFAKAYLELQRMREAVQREEQWAQASPDCSVAAVREDARSMAKAARVNGPRKTTCLIFNPDQTAERPQAAFLLVATNGL